MTPESPDMRELRAPSEALLAGAAAQATPHLFSAASRDRDAVQREGFRVGALNLMVRYEDGSELAEMPPVCRLPNAPDWFLGMTNLHGALVPVFDPAARWGTVHDGAARNMLLVLGHGEQRAGVVIDGLPTRLKPTAGDRLQDAPEPSVLAGCVAATHRIEGKDWMDLNCAALLERLQRDLSE
jgi:chemotaxis signal transduction protein